MFEVFAATWAYVVNGPPLLVLPLAWQLLLIEQTEVNMGCTSVENLGEIPAHENVLVPPPLPPLSVLLLLLHDAAKITQAMQSKPVTVSFFIVVFFVSKFFLYKTLLC